MRSNGCSDLAPAGSFNPKKLHNSGGRLNALYSRSVALVFGSMVLFLGCVGAEHHSPAYLQMEFLGRNRQPVSPVTMHDVTGCNLGGGILSYQNKHLWLLPGKQSSTSHCTLSYGLPLSFCMSKTGKKNLPRCRSFYPPRLIALAPVCSTLLAGQCCVRGQGRGWCWWPAGKVLLHPWAVSVPEEAKTEKWWLDPAQRIVEQF